MRKIWVILIVVSLFFSAGCNNDEETSPKLPRTVTLPSGEQIKILKTYGDAYLGTIDTSYGPVYVAKLRGSHYQMGYQYGYMMGDMVAAVWWTFVNYLASQAEDVERGINMDLTINLDLLNYLFGKLLDLAWEKMEPYVPQEFKDEIRGIADGANAAGFKNQYVINGKLYTDPDTDFGKMIERMIAISNISDLSEDDFLEMLRTAVRGYSRKLAEYYGLETDVVMPPSAALLEQKLKETGLDKMPVPRILAQCSFFAAYGNLTEDGHMIASRNLDWSNGSGIAEFKLLTIWMPDGDIPHMTIGYAGFIGALAGFSEAGIGVGEVGSGSVMERLKGEPWVLKFREILGKAHNIDDAIKFVTNNVDDGFNRPPTIGYNWMVAYGDPENGGKNAEVANFENNGAFTGMYRRKPDCSVDARLYAFDIDGRVAQVYTHSDHPFLVNYEGQAVEIMLGNRKYPEQITSIPAPYAYPTSKPVALIDGKYQYYASGSTLVVGKPIACAVYRGDEMMIHGMRMWQTASNGPWTYNGPYPEQELNRLLVNAGSYNNRYLRMYKAIYSYMNGIEYKDKDDITGEDKIIVPDNGGEQIKIGIDEGANIASWAAMHCCNVISVAYDLTALKVKIAYETGTGDDWKNAADNEYHLFDIKELANLTVR